MQPKKYYDTDNPKAGGQPDHGQSRCEQRGVDVCNMHGAFTYFKDEDSTTRCSECNEIIPSKEAERNVKGMDELKIYAFQAKHIEDTLRIVANTLKSHSKETCLDRDVMQAWEFMKNVLSKNIDTRVKR